MNKKNLKVLYLFAGERKKTEAGILAGTIPDSYFIGFNYMEEFGIDASYIENKFLNYIRKKNYNLTNIFLIPILYRYDVVFSGASLLLPFIAKYLFRMRHPKFVWYNTFFTNILKRNHGKPLRLWAVRKAIASLDAIFCPSTAQRQFLIDQGFNPEKLFYIPNGVDVDFMLKKQAECGLELINDELFILSVGKDMGRDYKTLAEAVKDLPVQVKVAALPRNFSEVTEVPKNLKILGFVPFNELVKLYNSASIIVISTKSEKHLDASDCSGQTVLLDAMSLGRPIIASKRETLADYFLDKEDGVVVESENPVALREAIVDLLKNNKTAEVMGGRCAQKTAKLFTTKILAESLSKLFLKIASK